MRILHTTLAMALCLLLLAGCGGRRSSTPDQDALKARSLVERASATLDTYLKGVPGKELRRVLAKAKGALIVPDMGTAGFLFSVDTGNGVLFYRGETGWSGPVFLTEASGGFGMQAGFSNTSGVFVYTDEDDIRYLLETGGVFQGRASVTVLNTNLKGKDTPKFVGTGDVYFVGNSTGLYAGAAVHGGGLISRDYLNEAYYGSTDGSPEPILFKDTQKAPEDALALRAKLAQAAERGARAQDPEAQKKDGAETPSK